jgi:hypothetical protein
MFVNSCIRGIIYVILSMHIFGHDEGKDASDTSEEVGEDIINATDDDRSTTHISHRENQSCHYAGVED